MTDNKEQARYDAVIAAPFAHIGLRLERNRLAEVVFLPTTSALVENSHLIIRQFQRQLQAYCDDATTVFDLPVTVAGTPYQKRVWQGIRNVPVGETISYSALAENVSSGARAVANACRRNPLPIVTPCHRVVAQDGPGGFAGKKDGYLLEVKQWLLRHEASVGSSA